MSRRREQLPWYRKGAGWIIAFLVALAGIAAFMLWPRGPVYAHYADGVRPTVVFVWSDPTPHHPHG